MAVKTPPCCSSHSFPIALNSLTSLFTLPLLTLLFLFLTCSNTQSPPPLPYLEFGVPKYVKFSPFEVVQYQLVSPFSRGKAILLNLTPATTDLAGNEMDVRGIVDDSPIALLVTSVDPYAQSLLSLPYQFNVNSSLSCPFYSYSFPICPSLESYSSDYVISLTGPKDIGYWIEATTRYIIISMGEPFVVNASITKPLFVEIDVTDAVISKGSAPLEIRITSDSDILAYSHLQYSDCKLDGVTYMIKTFSKSTFFRVDDYTHPPLQKGQWFLKLSILPQSNDECQDYSKTFAIQVRIGLSIAEYTLPIVLSFTVFFVIIFGYLLYLEVWNKRLSSLTRFRLAIADAESDEDSSLLSPSSQGLNESNHEIEASTNINSRLTRVNSPTNSSSPRPSVGISQQANFSNTSPKRTQRNTLRPADSSEFDLLFEPDELSDDNDGAIFNALNMDPLFVSDLSQKSYHESKRTDVHYLGLLFVIIIYYLIPAFQISILNEATIERSERDLCYYNLRCAMGFGPIRAFNNVISNNGYILLGLALLLITYQRSTKYEKERVAASKTPILGIPRECGLPRNYYLFYSLGLSMFSQGLFSALYHVCPTKDNFQFDTTFTFLTLSLLIITLYQKRHPDIRLQPTKAFLYFATLIFFNILGTFFNTGLVWGLTFGYLILLIFVLSFKVYYHGHWKFKPRYFIQLWKEIVTCEPPREKALLALIIFVSIVNIVALICGVIFQPQFTFFLCSLICGNFAIYLIFYMLMKKKHDGSISLQAISFSLIGLICLVGAIVCLSFPIATNFVIPHEQSECILLSFYDYHDIWHFLSSFGLFFFSLALLTIDDDLNEVQRSQITVF